jgi:mycofactocin system glycosyltransferase
MRRPAPSVGRPVAPSHLPDGFVVRLRSDVRIRDNGRAIVGGSPTRVLYPSAKARGMFTERTIKVIDAGTRALAERLLDAGMADPVLAELPDPQIPVADITFVIPVWGRPGSLDRLLTSIPNGHPLIVVDDRSPDPDSIASVAARHGARYIPLPENVGPGGARNAGLELVSTPFVAFVDTDVVIDETVVPRLQRHFADRLVAVVAPRVLGLADGTRTNWIGRYEAARSSLDLGPRAATVMQRSPVSWVPATFLLARVGALGDGFSPGMREGEDVDLIWRLVDGGWRVRYEPAARVWHDHRVTVGGWLSRKVLYGSSAHPLAVRHGRDIAPAVFAPWSATVVLALLAQRRWSVPVATLISAGAAIRIAAKLTRSSHPLAEGARLTADGVGASLTQTSALLVRHWWPAAVIAGVFSRRIRRAVIVAAVADAVIEYRRTRPKLDPIRFGFARRLDDLAYGAGVWLSAVRGRSAAALLPDFTWRSKERRPPSAERGGG